jgi:hypothetical protein
MASRAEQPMSGSLAERKDISIFLLAISSDDLQLAAKRPFESSSC